MWQRTKSGKASQSRASDSPSPGEGTMPERPGPRRMIVEGAKHRDFLRYDPKGYEEHVVEFLKAKLGG
jgi:hypothetical protein